ncbi:type II toxin-antitoxin system VapC family toxin [Bartonella harrusi]|uniref:Type II toxin-antitoxin system VapC family toxin n=1 Tax=Bartonella harrusi TaxID=2961895 RepID=A0ABY5ETG8_9HYPH|nr:type II toxin-antitoxin system VapC family toxin [Bartonella harrusi]UTO28682.1 type II toxin-antitoxin system VapC family toxin [Bartonella harrusi]
MFLDASAILAILLGEEEAPIFIEKMEKTQKNHTSAMAVWEAVAGLCFEKTQEGKPVARSTVLEAKALVDDFLEFYNIQFVTIEDREYQTAVHAYMNFGKGTGSKARLNMGDCFAYACSKNYELPLLFKGNDFIHTDIEKI